MNTPLYWKDLLAEFRALLDEYGDDVGIPNDDGSWTLESDHGNGPRDKDRASRFRDLATRAGRAAGVEQGADPFHAWLERLKIHDRFYAPVQIIVRQEAVFPHPLVAEQCAEIPPTQSGWLSQVITASISECGPLTTLAEIPPPLAPASWDDITITVMTDFEVQIKISTHKTQNYNFIGLGFQDARTKTPNKKWATLLALSQHTSRGSGRLSVSNMNLKQRSSIEKYIQALRKILRAHVVQEGFAIPSDADPLPFDSYDKSYVAAFGISRSRSGQFPTP